jgi:hypothetical protein
MTCLVGAKKNNPSGSTGCLNSLTTSTNFVKSNTPEKNTSKDPMRPRTLFETQNITVENCKEALGPEEEMSESKPEKSKIRAGLGKYCRVRRAPGAKKTGSDKASFKNLFIEKEFQGTLAHGQPCKTPDLVQPPKFYIRPINEVNMKISTRKHSRQSALALSTRNKSQYETKKLDLGAGDARNSPDMANSKQI